MSKIVTGLVALGLAAGLAGCGGSSGGSSAASNASSSPTQTAGSAAASPTSSASTSSSAEPTTALTDAQLATALLRRSDAPKGYVTQPPPPRTPSVFLCNSKFNDPRQGVAGATFFKPKNGPEVQEQLISYASPTVAKRTFDAAVQAAQSCTHFTSHGQKVTVGTLARPDVGDDAAAVQLSIKTQGQSVTADSLHVRLGSVQMDLQVIGLGDASVLQAILQQAAGQALARLQRLG
ncbi:MAG TPA: hypothetical protein VG708_11235 [Mycobacteriales bacterium]|jgi:hypothetical protein|nr:hypothetical protein [Mycobacteriales bacterium]